MSISYKIQNVLLPQAWNKDKKESFLKSRNLKSKFGNKKNKVVDNGYVHFVQYNKKTNQELPMIDLEDGVKAFIEQRKLTYKTKRSKKMEGVNSSTTDSSSDPDQGKKQDI